jgi:redox-sensitive bicupin YhaK (pirin superfamily)
MRILPLILASLISIQAMTPRSTSRIVTAHQQREGGGFIVRRPIGGEISEFDPFLMLDHMGPVNYGPGEAVGASDHPHRGFETFTYVLSGGFHHKDSMGNEGNLTDGWCQWMTAGSGIVHSELPADDLLEKGGIMEGFQTWVNLPAKDKMITPRYQDTPPEAMPIAEAEGVWVRVIAGECMGKTAVIETRTPITMLDVRLQPGAHIEQPVGDTHNAFVYVYHGAGNVGADDQPVAMGQVALLSPGDSVTIRAVDQECRCLLMTGEPIGEPIARYGPFVMNTKEELYTAFLDFQAGRLGEIPGAEERHAKTRQAVEQQKKMGKWNSEL